MKSGTTIFSVGLNILLLCAILFVLRKPAEKLISEVSNNVVALRTIQTVTQTNFISSTASAPFDWSQIESEDYLNYAANLRGIGCPEETVRDILTAEINDLFAHRRQDLLRPFQSQFWDAMARGGQSDFVPKEIEEKLESLNKEKETLEKQIFRATLHEEKTFPPSEYESVLAGSLSSEKVQQLRDISERFRKLRDAIGSSDLPDPEKQKQHTLWLQQMDAEQKGVLSKEEMEEFNLRTSPFVQQLQNLHGFQASEEELRGMARLSLNEKPVPTDKKSPHYESKLVEQRVGKIEIDLQMKALLGESRFKDYERAKNINFRNLSQLARRYDLSPKTISEVYELTTSVFQEVRGFEKSNLDSDERDEALETIRQQTERAMIAKLGVRAAETYRRNFGNWDEIPILE